MKAPVSFLSPKCSTKNVYGGIGAYCVESIKKGEIVAAFGGWVVNLQKLKSIGNFTLSRSIQIHDDLYITPDDLFSDGDMINHSCDPNCGILGSQLLISMRDIQVDELITFDYAMSDSSDYDEFACCCNSKNCRKNITGQDWKIKDLQEKYAGYFSSYLQEKMRKK